MTTITCVINDIAPPRSSFRSEHGVSFYIETGQGNVLFDTGQSESALHHNLNLLGIAVETIDGLVLSHAHIDHTGGLPSILSQKPGLPVYASPDLFRPRFTRRGGEEKSVGLPAPKEQLTSLGGFRLNDTPTEVLPGVWSTGEINHRPEREGRSPHHVVLTDDGWQPDPYRDDMSLVIEAAEGLVVICGCCHAGLLNTLGHVRNTFDRNIIAVMGGTHLLEADEDYLQHVAEVLRDTYGPPHLHLNHCTGERAIAALTNAFGSRVRPCLVGTVLRFD
jgi:7,8-dihydropterin-6-yl-methyl-4-(beta-D-ribofuranosyl)aminobenzene 5'-phosphate synthase